jgi:hypothetical protein
VLLSCAKASMTEEPDAVIPHVRDCAGGAGQSASLLRTGHRLMKPRECLSSAAIVCGGISGSAMTPLSGLSEVP